MSHCAGPQGLIPTPGRWPAVAHGQPRTAGRPTPLDTAHPRL